MNHLPLYRQWFTRFCLYNLIFLILQFSYIFSQSNSFIHAIRLPVFIYIELITTVGVHLALYLILSILQTALLWGIMQHNFKSSTDRWQIIIWSLSICALLITNGYFFPLSIFSRLFLPELPHVILMAGLVCSLLPLSILLFNTLYLAGRNYPKTITLIALFSLSLSIYPQLKLTKTMQSGTTPNIILIGVDSLPPAAISLENTPTMARFIKQSVQFKETISPLARTYPAWSTILTGLYPLHHGAHYNLMPPRNVKSDESIAWLLQKAGYQSIFATDDRRFNNIGQEFGFQQIIGPKLGVNDILLGTFNDFPLSNLLVNLPFAKWLFPYNHMNRASYFSYYPQIFDNTLRKALASRKKISPLFLAVHFTLPHWPYAFASSSPAEVKDEYSVTERGQLFSAALHQADNQVAHLLKVLEQYGYLQNSLIVLLSDHGETLYTPGSRQTRSSTYQGHGHSLLADYFKQKTSTTLDMSAGHGSDLLSTDQYHCVLACKIYKHKKLVTPTKVITTRVALIDIAPTVRDFAGISGLQAADGISLLSSIKNQKTTLIERAFIMESGMLPNQFLTREKARQLGQQFFEVGRNSGQLHIRKHELATLDAMKLYAIIQGNWVLALYPEDGGYLPIIQRLSDGAWVDDINSDFAKLSPSMMMLESIQKFYDHPFIVSNPPS